ncbi:MAG: hypothetical protein JW874_12145 [Spirochaetales bacterium]|nr:hypothetical protein [Spirochaetales bacterium]
MKKRTKKKTVIAFAAALLLAAGLLPVWSCADSGHPRPGGGSAKKEWKDESWATQGKFNPGHYIALSPKQFESLDEVKYLDDPSVKGVNQRYLWRWLEPEKDRYDFSEIRKDLDYLANRGKQLVVFFMDRTFSGKSPLPAYLADYEYKAEDSFVPARWDPYLVERIGLLVREMARQFDSHPAFEGIAFQESALEITDEAYAKFGYTPEKYRDALITILSAAQQALPHSHVFWYANFFHDGQKYLHDIADAVEPMHVFMGGPDILPYNRYYGKASYPMYDKYKNRLVLFCSAQGDSYRHHRNDLRISEEEPLPPEGYLGMEEIFLFARDTLHVDYLFWDYGWEGADKGYRTFDDAIKVIRTYPDF